MTKLSASVRKSANQAYPEHEKLHAVAKESQAIGEFLEWYLGQPRTVRVHSIERVLATYF